MKEKIKAKKQIFLYLLLASVFLIAAVCALVFYMTVQSGSAAVMAIQITEIVLLGAAFILALAGLLVLVFCLLTQRPVKGRLGEFLTKVTLRLYPIAIWFSKVFRMSTDNVRASFIEINNQLVKNSHVTVPAEKVLVLLPHCLQQNRCERKLTDDISLCTGCGRCNIGEINAMCSGLGVRVALCTGGTVARKLAMEFKPHAVVAVACERDLFSGILDIRPLPAVGVLNIRPEGPCHNTRVDVSALEHAIRQIIKQPETASAQA